MSSRLEKARTFVWDHGRTTALELLFNFVLPYVIFVLAQKRLGDVDALLVSSGPPILWSIAEFLRHRRVDALSLLVLFGIALSLLAFAGAHSVHLLQLREKLVTAIVAFVFLGSAAVGRPLIYELARAGMIRKSSAELARFESLRDNRYFRRTMTIMTLVWGFGLLADAGTSVALIYTVSIRDYLVAGPILGYGTMGALALWTFWYARRQRRKGDARRAAEAQTGSPGHADRGSPAGL